MNRIIKIIRNLSRKEIQIIEKYISFTSKSKKKYLLFSLLKDEKRYSEEDISTIIFGKMSLLNLKKLEERLLQDIEDVILLNYNKLNFDNSYENDQSNTVVLLLFAEYYLKNGLYSEAYKKLRKANKIITDHNFVFLESIYYQLYCEYLSLTGNKSIDSSLIDSIHVLSELQYIQNLKLCDLKGDPEILKNENELLPVFSGDIKRGDYTKCLSRLTQLKHLIYFRKADKAEKIFNSIIKCKEDWLNKIPLEMYADILLQKVKINILKASYEENLKLIETIKRLGINSGNTFYEYLKMRFLNSYILGYYDICKSISFSFFSEKKNKGNITEETTNQWIYFNICLAFVNGQNASVLKMISQFPGYNSLDKDICLNIRILEIYLLILLDREDLATLKLATVKNIHSQINIPIKIRYKYVIYKLDNFLEKQNSYLFRQNPFVFEVNDQVPKQDYLGMELVTFEMFEAVLRNKIKKFQIAN